MPTEFTLAIPTAISELNVSKEGWTTYYVDGTNGNDNNNGLTWAKALKTIQAAIDKAESWATIYIKAGVYSETLILSKAFVHLIGEHRLATRILGNGLSAHTIAISSRDVYINELRIQHDSATYEAIYCSTTGSSVHVNDCVIKNTSGIALRIGLLSTIENNYIEDCNIGILMPLSYDEVGSLKNLNINTIHNNIIQRNDGVFANSIGIQASYGNLSKIYDNTITDFEKGLTIAANCSQITVKHNNFINNTTQIASATVNPPVYENYFDDYTTDTNNDGLCDAAYAFTGGSDTAPLSKPFGWNQLSLGYGSLTSLLDLTTFTQETAVATDVNGTTWKDLLDKSTLTKVTKICGFMVTMAGAWAGNPKIRITDGDDNKIFPFQAEYVEGTDFTSGVQYTLNFPIVVPVAKGYKLQFRSSNAGDGAGETLQLNNLDVIE